MNQILLAHIDSTDCASFLLQNVVENEAYFVLEPPFVLQLHYRESSSLFQNVCSIR